MNVADAVGDDAAKDAGDRVARKPRGVPQRLLGAPVPHGHDDGEPGAERRLAHAEEEAHGEQAGGVMRERHHH